MSEHVKKAAAVLLAAVSVVAVAVCAVQAAVPEQNIYTGRGIRSGIIEPEVRLDPSDIFNTGSIEELCQIQGIGERLASMIVLEREENGLYIYPEDILSVNGIGYKKLEQFRPLMKKNNQESRE